MDESFRRAGVLQRDLRVLNQKEDRDLQQRLNTLDRQFRYTRKMLQQRRDSLVNEQRRVVMVKVVEPKATVNIAMKEIEEHNSAETNVRGIQTSDGRRLGPSTSQCHDSASKLGEQSRSTSAPPPPPPSVNPTGSVRRRGTVQSTVSLMQMKNIATIDSISEKELARQRQRAREEMEKLMQFQREALHKRVAAFIEKMKDKSNMQRSAEPP